MSQKLFGKTFVNGCIGVFLTVLLLTLSLLGQSAVGAASKPDISKKVELQWYVIGNGRQDDTELVETEVNKYLKEKINATLKLNTLTWGDDFEQKMAVKIAAGEQFDITFTSSWALNYRNYASMSAFKDITGMLDTYAPKTKALLGENMLKGAEVNGKIYALPSFSKDMPSSYGVLLNKKLVNKFKINTNKIKKLEDLEAAFKTIKAKQPKVIDFYPFDQYGDNGIYDVLNYDNLNGNYSVGSVKRDGTSTTVVNSYETQEAKALFSLMNKWYKSGYINKSATADESYFNSNSSNIFAFNSNLYPSKCTSILESKGLDMIPISLNSVILNTQGVTSSMQAISATSKNPERALMFLELVNTDEKLSNLINYGIEGIHYKKAGEKTISQISSAYERYNPGTSWLFGNSFIPYSFEGSPVISEKAANEYVKSAIPSPLLGFSFDSEPVSTQIEKLDSIVKKYYSNLCLGKTDPSVYLPKMNKELKNAGLQKVLTEMQKQVDTFTSKNK